MSSQKSPNQTEGGHKVSTMKSVAGIAGVLMMLMTGAAVAQDAKLDDLKKQGFARVAIANEPPYTAVGADGKVSGAAPDVAREIFKRLGVPDIVASISEYGAMIPGLQAGRFDGITSALLLNAQLLAAGAHSQPIPCGAEAFSLAKGNPKT